MIPVNDAPLRKRAATEFKRAMAKLDKASAELRRFEQEDRPSFGRWMAATFGALLTELRENARLIHEQEDLMEDVEMEMIWSDHHNPRKAYAAVMRRRENPDAEDDFAETDADYDEASRHEKGSAGTSHDRGAFGDEEQNEDDFDPFEKKGANIPKEQRQAAFDEFVRAVLGINPKQMGKVEYAEMFARFEAEMFGEKANPFETHAAEKPLPGRGEARIKEIYRALVRRLHPDLRADGDAKVSAIWHEVQEAYEARNLDRLETLLALTEMQGDTTGGKASLSQMRGALEELNRGLRAIQRSIRGAKRDPAWGFNQTANRAPLEKRIRREMEEEVSQQRWTLSDLKRTIDEWSRPWHSPAKKPGKKPESPVKLKTESPKTGRPKSNIPEPVQAEFFVF